MLTTYRGGQADAVPVSPELWDATAIAVNGSPFHELVGPFAQRPWWKTHLECFEHFRADAWIVPTIGPTPRQRDLRTVESRFVDAEHTAVESRIVYRTGRGTLHAVARTTESYPEWLLEHPVVKFPDDMDAYADFFFDDPAESDLSEVREAIEGVGEKGLVTPLVGELFTSFLGAVREGGMAATVLDILDHPDYARRLRDRYVEYLAGLTRVVLDRTGAQAVFVNSNYSSPPIVSLAMYREWDKPVLAAIAAECRKRDVPVHLHQHGHTVALMEDLIEAGVSMVCPLLPPPQGDVADLAAVKRRFGSRIALKGHVDPIEVLLRKTPPEIEAEVARCIRAAGAGGGYILGTADSTVLGTPLENIHAFVEAGRRHGTYPLRSA
jgi:uroporphyrinogen decarboxylase